jgi:hypothetical protein
MEVTVNAVLKSKRNAVEWEGYEEVIHLLQFFQKSPPGIAFGLASSYLTRPSSLRV